MDTPLSLSMVGLGPPVRGTPGGFFWQAFPAGELPSGFELGGRFRVAETLLNEETYQIYRAHDRESGQDVKVKLLAPGAGGSRALREQTLLSSFDHPRLPRAIATFEDGGRVGFVQSFLAGPTLGKRFRHEGPFAPEALKAVMRSALDTLGYLHSRPVPVLHRDVKPSNLVWMPDGEVGVIDFDIASAGAPPKEQVDIEDLTDTHTVGFAPPEQAIGLEAVPASDLYALAASIAFLGTGRHPIHLWSGAEGRIVLPEGLPAPLAELLDWMLEPALARRCPSVEAALERLTRC